MRTKIFLLILLYADYSFSQQASVPEVQLSTPFIYTKQNLNNKNTVESDVKMKGSQIYSMTTNLVTAALTEANRFNQQLESLKSIQTNRLNKLPNLSDISDLPKLRELIADKTESKRGLQDRFEKNIKEQVSTRGLYLVILPAGAGCENCGDIKSGEYSLIAQKALASKAIKELKGTLISSVTEVTNKNDVSQRIESQVEGEMTLEQQLDDIPQLPKGRRIFLLAVKVGNQTGKGFIANIGGNSDELNPIEIVACEQFDVLIKTFKKLAIDESTVERLNQKINEVLPSINEQNKDNKNTIQTLWNDYNSSLDQLAKQTEEEKLKEKQKTQKLNSYIANFYPDGIFASDLYDSINKLTNQIFRIEKLINDTIRILASQKIFHPNQRKFTISSDQTQNEAITQALIGESKQIESELSTSTAYTEITTVYNRQTEDVKKAQITYNYGTINQLWAYIIPTDDEFILHLFVRRDVSKSEETSSTNKINTFEVKLLSDSYAEKVILKGGGANYADGSIVPISVELKSDQFSFEGWYDEKKELISKDISYKIPINGENRTISAHIKDNKDITYEEGNYSNNLKVSETSFKKTDSDKIENTSIEDIKKEIVGIYRFSFEDGVNPEFPDAIRLFFGITAEFYKENELIYCNFSQYGNKGTPNLNYNCIVKIEGKNIGLFLVKDYDSLDYYIKVGDLVTKFSYEDQNTLLTEDGYPMSRQEEIEEYIINSIIYNFKDSKTKMEIDDSSDLFTISLRILLADPNSKMTSMQFTIPKMKNDCIYGDLNRDGIKDMIVSINGYAIFEELADNYPFSFIFVFLAQDKKYNLICHSFSNDICGCSSGVFYPEVIQEGLILGDSKCFAQGDVPCCPSLIYSTTVGFDGNKLKFINKTNK
jgi:hypothetical protein